VYFNGVRLGLMIPAGLCGPLCWGAELFGPLDSVQVETKLVPLVTEHDRQADERKWQQDGVIPWADLLEMFRSSQDDIDDEYQFSAQKKSSFFGFVRYSHLHLIYTSLFVWLLKSSLPRLPRLNHQ